MSTWYRALVGKKSAHQTCQPSIRSYDLKLFSKDACPNAISIVEKDTQVPCWNFYPGTRVPLTPVALPGYP
eukprot:1464594-Rhodomonas_salina.1